MARLIDAVAKRVAPWRGADWRVLVGEGALLILAGAYLMADGERAEFILGLVVGAALLIDGMRQWVRGFRRLSRGRPRDLTLIRGAVGIVTGGLVFVLLIVQQITVVGVRMAIGSGGLAYGLLGVVLTALAIRSREVKWTAAAFNVLLVLLSLLLLYRVATADSIGGLLAVTAWLLIGSGIAVGFGGIMRLVLSPTSSERSTREVPPG